MQFNRVNNIERLRSPGSQWVLTHMGMCRNSTCSWIVAWRTHRRHFLAGFFCSVAAHRPGSSPPSPFSPSFHCFNSVTGACPSYCVGAHGWVARICQPRVQSSSRSWLPIVEAPGCLRHPISSLAMQLLSSLKL